MTTRRARVTDALVEDPSLVADPESSTLASAGAFAAAAAAVTVQRSGSDLPRLDEVERILGEHEGARA